MAGAEDDLLIQMDKINKDSRARKQAGTDTPFLKADAENVDYLHFGTRMKLPMLPYAFTCICAFCGTMDISKDK